MKNPSAAFATLLQIDSELSVHQNRKHTFDNLMEGANRSHQGIAGLYRPVKLYESDRIYAAGSRIEFEAGNPRTQVALWTALEAHGIDPDAAVVVFRLTPVGSTKIMAMPAGYRRAYMAANGAPAPVALLESPEVDETQMVLF